MADDPIRPRGKLARPHSFGWLRRPELDSPGYPNIEVWEKPNGDIYRHDAAYGDLVFLVTPRQRTE